DHERPGRSQDFVSPVRSLGHGKAPDGAIDVDHRCFVPLRGLCWVLNLTDDSSLRGTFVRAVVMLLRVPRSDRDAPIARSATIEMMSASCTRLVAIGRALHFNPQDLAENRGGHASRRQLVGVALRNYWKFPIVGAFASGIVALVAQRRPLHGGF